MNVTVSRFSLAAAAVATFILAYAAYAARLPLERLFPFYRAFAGLLFEALPFLIAGAVLSALLETVVPDRFVQRLAPRGKAGGILFGSLLGLALPICECGMIPVVRRLIRKGLPPFVGFSYLAAGPVLNPIVFASTLTALGAHSGLVNARFALAFAVAVALGLIAAFAMGGRDPLRANGGGTAAASSFHDHDHETMFGPRGKGGSLPERMRAWKSKAAHIGSHAAEDLRDTGNYLIVGCMFAAFLQTALQPEQLAAAAGHHFFTHLFMMGLAFVLSLCSTADAFVAASFAAYVPQGALLSFLVFGPMFDMKTLLMMLAVFKSKFVLLFAFLAVWLVLAGSVLFEKWGWV
nr:permease [Cohnella algarum]